LSVSKLSLLSCALGVGQPCSGPVEPLSDVRRAEARSAGIDRPDGVARSFQVSVYKVEPTEAVLACNLLAKDDVRAALRDEAEEVGPEMSLVVEAASLAGGAERLTWARTGPNRTLVTPPGAAQGVAPDANPGEEVALGVTTKVIGFNVLDAALVDIARCDMSGLDKLAQPRRREWIEFIVVGTHSCQLNRRGGEGGALAWNSGGSGRLATRGLRRSIPIRSILPMMALRLMPIALAISPAVIPRSRIFASIRSLYSGQ